MEVPQTKSVSIDSSVKTIKLTAEINMFTASSMTTTQGVNVLYNSLVYILFRL